MGTKDDMHYAWVHIYERFIVSLSLKSMWIVSEEEQVNEFNIYFDYAQNVVNLDIGWLPVQ